MAELLALFLPTVSLHLPILKHHMYACSYTIATLLPQQAVCEKIHSSKLQTLGGIFTETSISVVIWPRMVILDICSVEL